jgi:DNA-binding transcriptional LysR family regulator
MHQRSQNIPIEIFRTIITILETGSLTKAGLKLGLSQPAVSSQIKRIEMIVGGPVFHKTANGSSATELGKLVILHARKILEANDQTLALGGASATHSLVRVGMSSLLVPIFMANQNAGSLADSQIVSDTSAVIAKSLLDGNLDVACFFKNPGVDDVSELVIDQFDDPLIWVRSKHFVLSPGKPIPILSWFGDEWMTAALEGKGLSYRIAFSGQDFKAKQSAAEAGLGVAVLPHMLLPSSLIHAKEYYLPSLPTIKGVLCVRPGSRSVAVSQMIKSFSETFFKGTTTDFTAPLSPD